MAVGVRGTDFEGWLETAPSFAERLAVATRRRRQHRLQQGLVTAGWVGGSVVLLVLAAAGVLGLH